MSCDGLLVRDLRMSWRGCYRWLNFDGNESIVTIRKVHSIAIPHSSFQVVCHNSPSESVAAEYRVRHDGVCSKIWPRYTPLTGCGPVEVLLFIGKLTLEANSQPNAQCGRYAVDVAEETPKWTMPELATKVS